MRKTIAPLITLMCTFAALALAASPAKNSAFRWQSTKQRASLTFSTSKDGKRIKQLDAYNKCSQVPADFPSIRIRKGKFKKSATILNALRKDVHFSIQGHFVTHKKAKGTYDLDVKGCDKKPLDFVAKRFGKATG